MITNFKIFENKEDKRKFKPGDIIKSKRFNDELIFIVIEYYDVIKEYIVKSIRNQDYITFIRSKDYVLMTPDEVEEWKLKNKIDKFNI